MSANTVPAMLETRILLDGTPTDPTGTPTPTTYTYTTTTTTPNTNPTPTNTATPTTSALPSGNSNPLDAPATPADLPTLTSEQIALGARLRTFLSANPNANGEALFAWAISDLESQAGIQGMLSQLQANGVTLPSAPNFGQAPAAPPVPAPAPVYPDPNGQNPGLPTNASNEFANGYFADLQGTPIAKRFTINLQWKWDGLGPSTTNGQTTFRYAEEVHESRVTTISNDYTYVTYSTYLLTIQKRNRSLFALTQAAPNIDQWRHDAEAAEEMADTLNEMALSAALTSAGLAALANPAAVPVGLAAAVAASAAWNYSVHAKYCRAWLASWESLDAGIRATIVGLEASLTTGVNLPTIHEVVHIDTSTDIFDWQPTGATWDVPTIFDTDPSNPIWFTDTVGVDMEWDMIPQRLRDLGILVQ